MSLIEKLMIQIESGEIRQSSIGEDCLIYLQNDQSIDNLGMLYTFIIDDSFLKFIDPDALEKFRDFFIPRYYLKCIKLNPRCEWADSRYTAAWDAASWFIKMHNSGISKNKEILFSFIKDLSILYLSGNTSIKIAIINGFLEHIELKDKLNEYFKNWEQNENLKKAIYYGSNPRIQFSKKDLS